MTYVKALSVADSLMEKIRSGQGTEEIQVQAKKGFVQKPFELEVPEQPEVPFYGEYKALDDLETRIKEARMKEEIPEGTGPDTVEKTGGPKVNPVYTQAEGYPVKTSEIQSIIIEEANLRGIDPEVALRIFRHEGQGAYQSRISREGKGSLNGREASFGPWQLYTGGGLGNEYEKLTGRILTEDNNLDGIRKQTQFALDKAAENGWGAWYGRKPAGVGVRDGLANARPVGNWRE